MFICELHCFNSNANFSKTNNYHYCFSALFSSCSWMSSFLSKLLRKLLTFSWRVQSMPLTWSPRGLTLPSQPGDVCSILCGISSLGRSVVMVTVTREDVTLLSRDNCRGMISSCCTMGVCCRLGGQEIFRTPREGDELRVACCWEIFLLKNRGLATWFMDWAETFLNLGGKGSLMAFPVLWYAEVPFIISADRVLPRLNAVLAFIWSELWLDVLLNWGLCSTLIVGGSATEILRRCPEAAFVEDEELSDEFDKCFDSGRFWADDSFLVQAISGCFSVFLELLLVIFWLRLFISIIKTIKVGYNLQSHNCGNYRV